MEGKVKVHNAELFVECMQAADWSASVTATKSLSPSRTRVPTMRCGDRTSTGATKQREAFLEQQSLRDSEFRQKMEIAKKESERRFRDRAVAREREFENRLGKLVENNRSLCAKIGEEVDAQDSWRRRKQDRLYNEWSQNVFQPMQDRIDAKIASQSAEEIEERNCAMFQQFLTESNKKANGLFRDIIIESDYDPLAQLQQKTIRYKRANIAGDPTKNRSTREAADREAAAKLGIVTGTTSPTKSDCSDSGPRRTVPVQMWAHMEATPFGRYSHEEQREDRGPRNPGFLKSSVQMDHFHVLRGDEGQRVLRQENDVRGKRMVGTTHRSMVAECFRSSADHSQSQPTNGP